MAALTSFYWWSHINHLKHVTSTLMQFMAIGCGRVRQQWLTSCRISKWTTPECHESHTHSPPNQPTQVSNVMPNKRTVRGMTTTCGKRPYHWRKVGQCWNCLTLLPTSSGHNRQVPKWNIQLKPHKVWHHLLGPSTPSPQPLITNETVKLLNDLTSCLKGWHVTQHHWSGYTDFTLMTGFRVNCTDSIQSAKDWPFCL